MPDQQKYTNKLQGKRVLILGGSAGIGFGVAEASLENGARVTISSSNQKRIDAAVKKLQEAYPSKASDIQGFACDLGSDDVEALLVELLRQTGDVEHVVFTAGDSLAMMPLKDLDLAKAKRAGQIRFFAPMLLAKLLPKSTLSYTMTTGRIAVKPIKDWTIIASYAAGLHGMTKNLAVDLAPIRVNLISPGYIDTELMHELSGLKTATEEEKEKIWKGAKAAQVTGDVGHVEDVVEGYLAFMRDANSTGNIYSSDGGNVLL